MLKLIDEQVISSRMAKDVLNDMFITGRSASDIVKEKGLVQLTDDKIIDKLAQEVIDENSPVVNDYLSGKDKAFGFLVGQLMKKTSGKINPQMANQALKKRLSR